MKSIAEEIKNILTSDEDLALTFATDLFVAITPNDPNNSVTIFDTPGGPEGTNLDAVKCTTDESVQIRVRNSAYQNGYALANLIYQKLHGINNTTLFGVTYISILAQQEPFLIEVDEKRRYLFIINFKIVRLWEPQQL